MDWSLSKVMRIESGDVGISSTDLRAVLALYGVADQATVEQLLDDARTSRKQRWWTDARYRTSLPAALFQYIQFEAEAVSIRNYQNVLVPGLLQTREYVLALLGSYADDLDEATIELRIETRAQRRRQVLERPDPPLFLGILDESVLYREVGSREIMGRQLNAILDHIDGSNGQVRIRVLPFSAAAPIALFGPFNILDLEDEEGAMLYRETHMQDEVVQSSDKVLRYRQIFDQLWKLAVDDVETKRLIRERATAMLSGVSATGPA